MRVNKLVCILVSIMLITSCSTGRPFLTDGQLDGSDEDKGVAYLLGRRVRQDNQKAFSHFLKAANRGDAAAQNEVAYLYATGKGTPRNNKKAFLYYQKAAHQGTASAQYNLGLMYLHGVGTEKNNAEAQVWIEKAASNGFAPARAAMNRKSS